MLFSGGRQDTMRRSLVDGGGAMGADLVELYRSGSAWATEKVSGATGRLDAPTFCDGWDVRTLLDHMLETQRFFLASAQGKVASPPNPRPVPTLSDNPVADFETVRSDMLDVFSAPGAIERTGPSLGVAFSDILVHGWDLARATSQDDTIPDDLAEAAYEIIYGKFTPEQRKGIFRPEVRVGEGASAQERLLAYTGRDPHSTPTISS